MSGIAAIDIDTEESRGRIDSRVYGLHVEHIWTCVYPGIWVGPDSPIPNTDGIRKDLTSLLQALKPATCKYPGGYFTDIYDWRDGIGPREARTVRLCPTEPGREEPNQFGTAEFIRFCRLIGAEPYLSANCTTTGPEIAAQWVEYCNLDGNTHWAAERREHGYQEPFNVRYWAVGNEQYWLHSAEDYAARYRRWAHLMYNTDPSISLVLSGVEHGSSPVSTEPWNSDGKWAERLLGITKSGMSVTPFDWHAEPQEREVFYSIHPYFESPAECTPDEYYASLADIETRLPRMITDSVRLLDTHRDGYPRPRLCLDEYGLLHPGISMSGSMTQPALFRSALWLGCFFHICHEHPSEVAMANLPGTVNMEHELVLIEDGMAVATPSYHLFRLFRDHGGSESLGISVEGAPTCPGMSRPCLWALSSRNESGTVMLSVINLDLEREVTSRIILNGSRRIESATAVVLHADDVYARNTTSNPDTVSPIVSPVTIGPYGLTSTFPPHSVTVLKLGVKM